MERSARYGWLDWLCNLRFGFYWLAEWSASVYRAAGGSVRMGKIGSGLARVARVCRGKEFHSGGILIGYPAGLRG